MRLTSLWSSITAPRIKEITPQEQTPWLEKARPKSCSASTHTAKKRLRHFQPGSAVDVRPTTSKSEGKATKNIRGLKISKPRLQGALKLHPTSPCARDPVTQLAQDIPTPPSTFSPHGKHFVVSTPLRSSDEVVRPGTAVTTDDVVTAQVFELPANELSSPPIPSPLASPASVAPKSDLPLEGTGLRTRSHSTASGTPRTKRASWFQSGRRKAVELELPPPVPPSPLWSPQLPMIQPLFTELSDNVRRMSERPSLSRNTSTHGARTQSPISIPTEDSLENGAILDAFPSVPLIGKQTTKTAVEHHDLGPAIPLPPRSPLRNTFKRTSSAGAKNPRTTTPKTTIDATLRTTDGANDSPKRNSKQPSQGRAAEENHFSSSFGDELQREYDKTLRLMGFMDHKRSSSFITIVRKSGPDVEKMTQEQKFSNEEALAALEFGLQKV